MGSAVNPPSGVSGEVQSEVLQSKVLKSELLKFEIQHSEVLQSEGLLSEVLQSCSTSQYSVGLLCLMESTGQHSTKQKADSLLLTDKTTGLP